MSPLYQKCFENSNGRKFGDWAAGRFANSVFIDLSKPDNVHHDRRWREKRVEVKAIRATHKALKSDDLDAALENEFEQRALWSFEGSQLYGLDSNGAKRKLSNLSFQQTKSSEFDVFIGFVFFLDLVRVYVVPAVKIAASVTEEIGKIRITNQHRNSAEGHMTLEKIPNYMVFELTEPMNEIQARDLGRYLL